MSGGLLAVVIVVGTLLFTGVLVTLIVSSVRRVTRRQMAELEAEGIVLDSGRVAMTFHFRGFRGPMVAIGVGVRAGPGRIVLTRERLVFVPHGQNRFGFAVMGRADLARFTVDTREGRLHMHSDSPPNASGSVDILVSVASPGEWAAALARAGANG